MSNLSHGKFQHSSRLISINMLSRILSGADSSSNASSHNVSLSRLSKQDKSLVNEIVSGSVRWLAKLDWIISQRYKGDFNSTPLFIKNSLRVALYQILFLDKIPHSAAVNQAVELIKHFHGQQSANTANALLRAILRDLQQDPDCITYKNPSDFAQELAINYSHPRWLVRRWLKLYPENEIINILEANNTKPDISIRANSLKTNRDELFTILSNKLSVTYGNYHKNILHVDKFPEIESHPLFQNGYFTVQDEAAALAAALANAKPNMTVFDICSAPGGKAMNIAEQMQNKGTVFALDIYPNKLKKIDNSAERLGFNIIKTVLADATKLIEQNPTNSLIPDSADIVFVDAPCSGLGVIRKKADIKWKRTSAQINDLVELQKNILENVKHFVKPDGHLVYSTCTFEPAENQEIVKHFLQNNTDFSLETASNFLPKEVVTNEGFLQTMPHKHNTDGAFAARLRKRQLF